MTTRNLFWLFPISLLLASYALLTLRVSPVHAQSAPLSIGTWTENTGSVSCPASAGWLPGGTCKQYTVHCSGADDDVVTVDYSAPTGTSKGTIAFVAAEGGTSPNTPVGQELTFAQYYLSQGFAVVQTAWLNDWEGLDADGDSGSDSVLVAACRPATVLSAINASTTYHPSGAMCAQGASAGSARIRSSGTGRRSISTM
ncbi:MAG TPA: hypothetical protein VND65_14790 [Candidatus Binatia bacterium]|nr:hypothetical protein [Candidatus Binatia bacterium]